MKKIITFIVVLLTITLGALAETGIKLTFSNVVSENGTVKADVSVAAIGNVSIDGITATLESTTLTDVQTSNASAGKTLLAPTGTKNGWTNGTDASATFTFKIIGLKTAISTFNTITLGVQALDALGQYQGNYSRLFSFLVDYGESSEVLSTFGEITNQNICAHTTSQSANSENENYGSYIINSANKVASDGDLYIKITVTKTEKNGCYFGLQDIEITNNEPDWDELQAAYNNSEGYTVGDNFGEYTDPSSTFETARKTANTYLSGDKSQTVAEVSAAITALNEARAALTLNMPTTGRFLRFKNKKTEGYITAPKIGDETTTITVETGTSEATSSIWYYYSPTSGHNELLSYFAGMYINNPRYGLGLKFDVPSDNGGFNFADNTSNFVGTYQIYDISGQRYRYLYDTDTNNAIGQYDNSNQSAEQTAWHVEEVSNLPITLHKVGTETISYGTLYLPVAVDVTSGEGTEVYAVSETKETYVKLRQITGTIPAETGVVLVNTNGASSINVTPNYAYTYKYSETNELRGVYTATAYNPNSGDDNYYLTAVDDKPGFYQVENYSGKYITNKAYLPGTSTVSGSSKGFAFVFDDDDPTGINTADAANGGGLDVNAPMYNVQGVRVPTWYKGIVVQNGQKYLLK